MHPLLCNHNWLWKWNCKETHISLRCIILRNNIFAKLKYLTRFEWSISQVSVYMGVGIQVLIGFFDVHCYVCMQTPYGHNVYPWHHVIAALRNMVLQAEQCSWFSHHHSVIKTSCLSLIGRYAWVSEWEQECQPITLGIEMFILIRHWGYSYHTCWYHISNMIQGRIRIINRIEEVNVM